jgi:hypothetical protein
MSIMPNFTQVHMTMYENLFSETSLPNQTKHNWKVPLIVLFQNMPISPVLHQRWCQLLKIDIESIPNFTLE